MLWGALERPWVSTQYIARQTGKQRATHFEGSRKALAIRAKSPKGFAIVSRVLSLPLRDSETGSRKVRSAVDINGVIMRCVYSAGPGVFCDLFNAFVATDSVYIPRASYAKRASRGKRPMTAWFRDFSAVLRDWWVQHIVVMSLREQFCEVG